MLCNGILFYFYLLFLIFYNVIRSNLTIKGRNNNNNNLKHKIKSYQPKLEFLKTQNFINLKRRCNK